MNKQKEGKGKLQQEATLIVSSFLERLPIKAHTAVTLESQQQPGVYLKDANLSKRPPEANSLMQGTCRSSCSQAGWPCHCKQHEKPLSQTEKKGASGHRQGQNTEHREEHSNRSTVGRKWLQIQNAGQGIGMRSTGMEMLRLWGRWSYTREVTLDKLSFLKSSFNSAAQEGALEAAPQKLAFSATISIRFLRGSQALLEACESHQCSHSLLTDWRDGLPYKRFS